MLLFSTFGFTLFLQAQVKEVKRLPVVLPKGVKQPKRTSAAGNPRNLPSSRKGDNPMKNINIKPKPVAEPPVLPPEERKKRLPSNSKSKIVVPVLPKSQ